MYPTNLDEYLKFSAITPQDWFTAIFYDSEEITVKKLGDIYIESILQNEPIFLIDTLFYSSNKTDKYFCTTLNENNGLFNCRIDNIQLLRIPKCFSFCGNFASLSLEDQNLLIITKVSKNLLSLSISQNAISNIDFIDSCSNLIAFNATSCSLKTADIDRILLAFVNFGKNGFVLQLNTNEPPSETGLLNIAILQSRGWTVLYNLPLS